MLCAFLRVRLCGCVYVCVCVCVNGACPCVLRACAYVNEVRVRACVLLFPLGNISLLDVCIGQGES